MLHSNYSDPDERKYWDLDSKLVVLNNKPGYKLYFCESEEDNYEDSWFVLAKTERSAKIMWRDFSDNYSMDSYDITAFPVAIIPEKIMKDLLKHAKKFPERYNRRGTSFVAWVGIIKSAGVTLLSKKQPYTFIYNGIIFEEGCIDAQVQDAQDFVAESLGIKRRKCE